MEFTRMQNACVCKAPDDWNLGEVKSGLDLPAVLWAHIAGDGGDAANSKRRKHVAAAGADSDNRTGTPGGAAVAPWTEQRSMWQYGQWTSHARPSSWQGW